MDMTVNEDPHEGRRPRRARFRALKGLASILYPGAVPAYDKGMNTPRGFEFLVGWRRRLALAAAVLLILGPAVFSIAQSGGQEDALVLIQKHGTAGMRLQGGRSIEVRDNKLYVRSGQTVRALFADKASSSSAGTPRSCGRPTSGAWPSRPCRTSSRRNSVRATRSTAPMS